MKELVHEAASESFDGYELFSSQRAKLGVHAPEFAGPDFLRLPLQGDDSRSDIDGAAALVEALDFRLDHALRIAGLRLPLSDVRGGHLLQVVDVVDEDAFHLV